MNYFKKILIPVDFSINTNVAVKKALELATPGITTLHLLHIYGGKSLIGKAEAKNVLTFSLNSKKQANILNKLAEEIQSENNIDVTLKILPGKNVQNCIVKETNLIKPDLIVIGKRNQHMIFPYLNTVTSSNLSEITKCNVLTTKPGAINKKIQTIVLPVFNYLSSEIIAMLSQLNSKAALNIHLITTLKLKQFPDNQSASKLLQSIRFIRNTLHCNVHHSIINSDSKALAMLRYAEKVNADLLLVNTKCESRVNSWMSRKEITDIINPASRLQILTVQSN